MLYSRFLLVIDFTYVYVNPEFIPPHPLPPLVTIRLFSVWRFLSFVLFVFGCAGSPLLRGLLFEVGSPVAEYRL